MGVSGHVSPTCTCRTRAMCDSECECAGGWEGVLASAGPGLPWKPAASPLPCQPHVKMASMTDSHCTRRPVRWKTLAGDLP